MTGRALIAQADALRLPLADASVDLIVTSPPYWQLRAYGAGPGEIGSEPDPAAFLEALWAATREMVRVLKPSGSMFINLGDKYNSSAHHMNGTDSSLDGGTKKLLATEAAARIPILPAVREKSLFGLPWAYVLGCTGMLAALGGPDPGLNLIWRAELVWHKVNGLPESATDRVRRSHEIWLHLVKSPRYYAAIDELREPYSPKTWTTLAATHDCTSADAASGHAGHRKSAWAAEQGLTRAETMHPLGALPGSVWSIPSEPLDLPGYFTVEDGRLSGWLAPGRGGARRSRANGHLGLFDADAYAELATGGDGPAWRWVRATGVNASPWPRTEDGLQLRVAESHYAAFPSRWPEQLIKAWSPPGICTECGEGRFPVSQVESIEDRKGRVQGRLGDSLAAAHGPDGRSGERYRASVGILGYACACTPFTDHLERRQPTRTPRLPEDPVRHTQAPSGHQNTLYPRQPVREWYLDGWQAPPTRPAVVLDPFGGTGTTAMVARALGRIGLSFDLSEAYSRAARWRVFQSAGVGKAVARTNRERQVAFDLGAAG